VTSQRRDIRVADEADQDRLDRIERLIAELAEVVCEHDRAHFAGSSPEGVARRNRLREAAHQIREAR
jgi:hypothetical protein